MTDAAASNSYTHTANRSPECHGKPNIACAKPPLAQRSLITLLLSAVHAVHAAIWYSAARGQRVYTRNTGCSNEQTAMSCCSILMQVCSPGLPQGAQPWQPNTSHQCTAGQVTSMHANRQPSSAASLSSAEGACITTLGPGRAAPLQLCAMALFAATFSAAALGALRRWPAQRRQARMHPQPPRQAC